MKILNLIYPDRSDIKYKSFNFPDGQPHLEIEDCNIEEKEFVHVICRITSPNDIATIGLAVDCLASFKKKLQIIVEVSYMLGGRMDRRIGKGKPFTLKVLSRMLRVVCRKAWVIRILDPHSKVSLEVGNSKKGKARTFIDMEPKLLYNYAITQEGDDVVLVYPDQGAVDRNKHLSLGKPIALCSKKRDSETGKLSGFKLEQGDVAGKNCLIVDDICDGGGTFIGQVEILKAAGAKSVSLCVTHGIFSKGFECLKPLNRIYTTDSYQNFGDFLVTHTDKVLIVRETENSFTPRITVLTNFVEASIV